MKTSVKHLSETKVILTISLTSDELADAKQVALHKLSRDVKAPGFRKGKVPASVAAKYVAPAALDQQTIEDALSKAVAEAFLAENLQALERPAVEIKKYVPEQELEFTAETEIIPPVKLGNYKKLKLKKEKAVASKQEIDETLERVRTSLAEKSSVKRAAKDGDEAVIDFVGKKDGIPFEGGTGDGHPLMLGSNSFIPGFEEGIVGHKAGEVFDVPLTFPAEYHAKDLAGQKVVFTVTLNDVKEAKLPELDDKLAAKAGPFKTLAELTDDIKRELSSQKQRESDEKLKDDAVKQLIAASKVPVPDILVNDQSRSIEQDFLQNLSYRGMTLDQYIETSDFKDREEWLEKEVKPAASDRVKAGLLLAELSKAEKIEASSEELAEAINKYKQQYANNPEMAKRFDDSAVQRDIANRLLTEKTVDRLVELNS
ncbi:MAG: trigger factor [Candidatus Saccharimonadaceae bacterium]